MKTDVLKVSLVALFCESGILLPATDWLLTVGELCVSLVAPATFPCVLTVT